MSKRSTKEDWLRGESDVTSGKVMNAHHSLKLKTWREQLQDAEQRGRTKAARHYRKKIADLEANWSEIQRRQADA